ncbi:hypothetical protein ORIO_20715 (plasmid) [Cereibacter azotoformans]|uniref:Toxin-antitoxin system HicB family antitoxin n=1 Tax=Cereibacter sphaeroides (strain ATCC 17025 / ATH 2.4.3) TaxID=349102 RepID=A4X083_CERS5|nr:hypothetical protein [Cereibacter azotoformans]AXQ96120.1 hypothetical protein D0Z66_20615 [Cereibacter sphaeroides]UIJ32957.1 hypothetical protein LV780_20545 [Cereibacter azotoformans]ULB12222.1 hypothetical protein ORIO_20715 [Cereibacter azotoformans]
MSSYALRMPDHLMQQAREASAQDNVSINQLLVTLVAEGLGHRRALMEMKERAARGNPEAALHILQTVVPDVPPDPDDEIKG